MSSETEQELAAQDETVEEGAAAEAAAPDSEPEPVPDADTETETALELEEDLAAKRDEYLALAQRTQADFENYRKRAGRDVAAAEARGIAKVVTELLQPLDHITIALEHIGEEDDEAARALRNAEKELHAALERLGVESYSPDGEAFDPTVHEAMTQAPAEGVEAGTITAVYQRGYRAGGAVLRPARVVVAA